ncbi:flagellar export protein FliJ [Oceanispirochaeta crateris]|uniref:Flagellar FliJ protein n=1 Tax=Oceanispirochaeta crateris TaxID=2518645 RepID=A0A5C1QLN5_9SPIO|nr:flagellar export protein FliJ [Oceanispirochaeta crateris]QEN07890.1 flagellar export protein FliJ [Oceanispirochaeta crateris]
MKRFQFTLDSILELRLEEEQEAEMHLGRAMGEWNHLNEKKMKCMAIRESQSPAVRSEDLLQSGLYYARINQEIHGLQKEMDSREGELEHLRENYRVARSKREGLDKLKEKRKKEHSDIQRRAEAHTLDDLLNNMNRLKQAGD